MKASVEYIQAHFDEYNRQYFGGQLPPLPEEVVQDTILHEMIHYYIAVNQLKDTSSHGRLFRAEMARINAEGNRHIRISYRLSPEDIKCLCGQS